MDSSVQIGSDVVAYEDSTPETIILQLKTRLREIRLFHDRREQVIHNQMEASKEIVEEAYRQWNERQNKLILKLDITMSRKEHEIGLMKQKIARYRILNEYGSEICVKSYQLAKEADDTGDYDTLKTESENEVLIYQIAYDLIQGKLGMWPSDDIDLWFDFAQMKQITGQTLLSNFTQSLISNDSDEYKTNSVEHS
uniref:Uncharacterized protein n=1 Tax=Marseillevirus LCMAC101 TaxID=2506602 RepID=A0A481YRQ6_9VIRU|nr:MAG: hypothetical protein LCMAC101_05480 [Marseillevirus LCMAC101]